MEHLIIDIRDVTINSKASHVLCRYLFTKDIDSKHGPSHIENKQ